MGILGRTLLVDDEEVFLLSTAELLRDEGYACDCAADAATAIKMLHCNRYDILIADVKMPGNEKLQLIQNLPRIAEGIPVILVTSYPSLDSAIQAIQLSVSAYVLKPFDFNDFLRQVKRAIERSQTQRAIYDIRHHLQDWHNTVQRSVDTDDPLSAFSASVSTFFTLAFSNIVRILVDLQNIVEAVAPSEGKQNVCRLLGCPRSIVFIEALRETISVLEKTRSAFKSKELGALRRKLEKILKNEMGG